MIQKKEQSDKNQQQYGRFNSLHRIPQQRKYDPNDSLPEIDEETDPNINNGMLQILDYNRLKDDLELN